MLFLSQSPNKPSKAFHKNGEAFFRKGEDCLRPARLNLAQDYFEKSLKNFGAFGDVHGTALCLLKLGRVLELKGQYDSARGMYQEADTLYRELNDQDGQARCQAYLGSVAWAQGDYPESSRKLKLALETFHSADSLPGRAWVHDLLGNLQLAMGAPDEAETCHRAAFALAQETGIEPEGEAWNNYHQAAIAFFRNNLWEAGELFTRALGVFQKLEDDLGVVATRIHLGEIACERKELALAQDHLREAVQLALPTQCWPLLTDCLSGVAQLLKAKGEGTKAIPHLMVALSHPTCRRQTKDRMVSLSESLGFPISNRQSQKGFAWAKDFTLEEMAQSWLASLNPKSKA